MSKVKDIYDVRKEKAIHSLRRFETRKKKQNRIKNSDKFYNGYYVRKDKRVGIYETVEVPEQKKIIRNYEHKIIRVMNSDGEIEAKYVSIPTLIEKVIPAHIYKSRVGSKYIPVPVVPRRINSYSACKKLYKKLTTRKVRHSKVLYNNNSRKKLEDLMWALD